MCLPYYLPERMTVNHDATGSSPVTGASEKPLTIRFKGFFLLSENYSKYRLWDRKFLREMGFKRVIRWAHNGFLSDLYMQKWFKSVWVCHIGLEPISCQFISFEFKLSSVITL